LQTDILKVDLTVQSSLAPYSNNNYDIGTTSLRWRDGWFARNLTASGDLSVGDTVLINGAEKNAQISINNNINDTTSWKKSGINISTNYGSTPVFTAHKSGWVGGYFDNLGLAIYPYNNVINVSDSVLGTPTGQCGIGTIESGTGLVLHGNSLVTFSEAVTNFMKSATGNYSLYWMDAGSADGELLQATNTALVPYELENYLGVEHPGYDLGTDARNWGTGYFKSSVNIGSTLKLAEISTLPASPASGWIVNHNDTLKFYNGTAWKTIVY
jgi:hypothetical protein